MGEKALVVCNHPGGARAVLPVVERMIEAAPELRFELLLTRHSLPIMALPSRRAHKELRAERVSAEEYVAMDLQGYRFVLTGTSIQGNLETSVIRKARLQRVPVFTVLDHWCEYEARFGESGGQLTAIPDVIFVPDPIARADLLSLGIPEARIVVSGHPAFDRLPGIRARFSEDRRAQILGELELPAPSRFVLFVSEPVAADHGHRGLGYSEFSVLDGICAALERVAAPTRPPLVIKPHPREGPDKFHELLGAFPGLVTRTAGASIDRHDVILASGLVLGIDSVLLVEASILGAPTYSVRIGESGRASESAPGRRVPAVRDPDALVELLRAEWRPSPPLEGEPDGGASQAIVDAIRAYQKSA